MEGSQVHQNSLFGWRFISEMPNARVHALRCLNFVCCGEPAAVAKQFPQQPRHGQGPLPEEAPKKKGLIRSQFFGWHLCGSIRLEAATGPQDGYWAKFWWSLLLGEGIPICSC